jgi:scyllo-inositol 2-dehydrogenase (NADP+)
MNPVKTGLASFGMSGIVFHAPLTHTNKSFELVKILERSKSESREKYPEAKMARSFNELCKDDTIELIIVNTPDNTHYELAKKALEAGKHVVVEKPFTQKYAEGMELAALADKKGLVLSVFHNRRWDGDFLTVRKILAEGLLGRLVEYEAHFDRYRNFIQDGTWKEDPSTGVGTLYNLGSHLIDQALSLFGKPLGVTADVRIQRTGGKIDDSFELWLAYPDIKVTLCGGYLVREPGPRYTLHGTEGSYLKWGIDPQEEDLKQGKLPNASYWGKEERENWGLLHTGTNGTVFRDKYETIPGNYNEFYNDIFDAIRTRRSPKVTAEQAAFVIRVIEAAFESVEKKKTISLLP